MLFKKFIALSLILVMMFALFACSSGVADTEMFRYNSAVKESQSYRYDDTADAGGVLEEAEMLVADSSVSARKIIYSSSYEIETKDYDSSVKALSELCGKYSAYFEKSNTYGYDGQARRSEYVVRVPAQNYKSFIGETGNVGSVVYSGENNTDITESYYDTEARLESARIREERVLEILKNASLLDDVLALERELADIRYEIETYTGTLRKYDSLVSYSTVNITIREVQVISSPKTDVLTFSERMSKSFRDGYDNFVSGMQSFLIWVSYNTINIAIFVIIALAVGLFVGFMRKKYRKD